jgi:hypothetical protein
LRAYSEVRIAVPRAVIGGFPVLIITILAAAARAGSVPAGLVLIAALVLLYQASSLRPQDLLPGYRLPSWREFRQYAAGIELAEMQAWTAKMRGTPAPAPEPEKSRAQRVAELCAAELDAYQASLPGYSTWGPA